MRTSLLISGIACTLLTCRAWGFRVTPKPDETLSQVAIIYYGEMRKMIYIQTANRIANPDKLEVGRSLLVPNTWRYTVKKGEDLAQIAGRLLKDARRADFLVWLNRVANPRDIKPGTVLAMPFLLQHRVTTGQNLSDVTKLYYFGTKEMGLVRKFNRKQSNVLTPNEVIEIPIFDPEVSWEKITERVKRYQQEENAAIRAAQAVVSRTNGDPGQDNPDPSETEENSSESDSNRAPGPASETENGSRQLWWINLFPFLSTNLDLRSNPGHPTGPTLAELRALWSDGEYERVRELAQAWLKKPSLATEDEFEARRLLACAWVALDEENEAEYEFVRLLMKAPQFAFDPDTTSPKILEAFRRAKGNRPP